MTEEFQNNLDAFIFFHLGSDTVLTVEEGVEQTRFHLEHPRIHPFTLELSAAQMQLLARDAVQFEQFMLKHLVRYRR